MQALKMCSTMVVGQKDRNRFWEKVDVRGKDDCWEWTGTKSHRKYGNFWFVETVIGAHRFSWMMDNGEIPEGMYVCHKCDNPGCVNPSHLFLGNCTDNMQDAAKKGRIARGERRHGAKLTESQVGLIRKEYENMSEKSQSKLAKKYKVSQTAISKIILKKRWKHI